MLKLTKKQNETVDLIRSKERELGKKLYIAYANGINKMFLVDVINDKEDLRYNQVDELNTKVTYALLDKNALVSEKINDKLSLVTLNREVLN